MNHRLFAQLVDLLSPWEPALMRLQSLLVGERPLQSVVFTGCVHATFWYLVLCGYTTLFLVTFLLILFVLFDLWTSWVWPEIKVPGEFDKEPNWVPIHPHLLSVHELAAYVSNWWSALLVQADRLAHFRKNKRATFFVLSSFFWLALAYLGTLVAGRILVYVIVILCLIMPSIMYNELAARIRTVVGPMLSQLDEELSTRRLESPSEAAKQEAAFHPSDSQWSDVLDREMLPPSGDDDESDLDSLHDFDPLLPTAESTVAKGLDRRDSRRRESGDLTDDSSFEFIDL